MASSERLFTALQPLGHKCGPMLLQLPPHWKANAEHLDAALSALPSGRYAVEPRDPDWFCESVYHVLRQHHAALCLSDFAGHQTEATLTCDFVYLRLHGPGKQPYRGSYVPAALEALAGQLIGWVAAGLDAFVYFDNDEAGYAALNARDLLARLDRQRDETAPPKTQGLFPRRRTSL